ncbi:AzlD domain-containing protein [Amphritea sp. 2_MG-2023]|jgi:branched-subunit amino acid transport protein|uniref:AzlD domain-containing protein n=1 Tax=Amphritea TaxID=515417 RepID=UPI001C06E13C|nr:MULTISPECIES: AzlD domain-containing protein [Amphritea]MBU2965261.1 AzlD domain-containing protein [Amphritea atlantica]MDO6420123.1 AzlD domain-containing protein [Amphritea sp. 2_MG-2023]MDX2421067.1 AzlD domain-containing protein [Amphritea sp.]
MSDNLQLWLLFVAVGLGTFLIRLSFIQFHGSAEALIARSKHVLTLLPPAILAALCIPAIVFTRPLTAYQPDYFQWIAALIAILIARFSRSVFWPVAGGMICLWLLRYLTS